VAQLGRALFVTVAILVTACVGPTASETPAEHGWSQILSGLKTLIETGQPLAVGEPTEEHAELPP
jgi:hypothetical protein